MPKTTAPVLEVRSLAATLERRTFQVRALDPEAGPDDAAARTFVGLAVPWDETTDMGWGQESVARGAFGAVALPIPLYAQHAHLDGGLPVGVVTRADDTDAGLEIEARISETPAGNEVYQLMRDGALSRLSIGFEPIVSELRQADDVMVRTEARLWEVSVVGIPAYAGAAVSEVRTRPEPAPVPGSPAPVVDLEARAGLEDLERRIAALPTTTPTPAASQYRSAGEALKALARGEEAAREVFTRAYTGAVTGDTHIQTGWVERAIALVDRGRPVIGFFDTEPLPAEGLTVTWPKFGSVTDGTAKQAAQGDDLGYYELGTTTGTANVDTYGNYAQVTRQIIDRAPTSYLDALFRGQVIAYAKATEAAARTALTGAAGTNTVAMGAALAASTVPQWLSAVIDAAAAIDTNSLGLTAEALWVATDVYKKLAGFLDTAGRPIFAYAGGGQAVNALGGGFGVVRPAGQIADLPLLVNSQLTNGTAIVAAPGAMVIQESPGAPVRLDDENIINLSQAYSVYGYLVPTLADAKGLTKITFP